MLLARRFGEEAVLLARRFGEEAVLFIICCLYAASVQARVSSVG